MKTTAKVDESDVSPNTIELSNTAHELAAQLNRQEEVPASWLNALCTVAIAASFIAGISTVTAGSTAIVDLIVKGLDEG